MELNLLIYNKIQLTHLYFHNLLMEMMHGQPVFITHTLPPSTSGFRGYNNAGLWQISGTDVYSKW